ncbi:MAG: 50S ribosomal protein L24 [Candidatus Caldarchaeum sp.]|nr:50S ribosomal protein L24 [Candidatus Caldarchaeum sp.]MDW7978036.1 50S ribosomal protein L24 [Candidatus Caldarchaeum sp.]MDW8360442.1 50S ribosomal protein L24 [Candidatus Caldarchaeum sp.]
MQSRKPSKQRFSRFNAPRHILVKFMRAHLSPELRTKYGKRSYGVRVGDTVKVMKGVFKGVEGKVKKVDIKRQMVYLENVSRKKTDGSSVDVPIRVYNLMLTQLNLDDKRRKQKLEVKT